MLVLFPILLASCENGNDVRYTEGEGPKNVGSPYVGLLTGDSPPQKIYWITVTLENPPDGAAESLDADTSGTGIAKTYTPATGVLSLTGDASTSEWAEVLGTVTYTNTSQNPTYSRNVKFAMRVVTNDGTEINPFTGTNKIFVQAVNDAPTAGDDPEPSASPYATTEETVLNVGAEDGLLANDTDVDDAASDLRIVDGDASDADAAGEVDPLDGPANGTLTLREDGSFSYAPDAGFSGVDTFTYGVGDGNGGTDSATVTITVEAVNDEPTISDIADVTVEEDATTGEISFTVGDEETPATDLTLAGTSDDTTLAPNANITFGGSGTNRTVRVSPASGEAGTATITITVSDAQGVAAAESFGLTVEPVNDAPTARADSYRTDEDKELEVPAPTGVLNNDGDPDGDRIVASLVRGPKQGRLTLSEDGSFAYIPRPDSNGIDTFAYRASDGSAVSDAVEVSIRVRPIAETPGPETPECTIKGTRGNDAALIGTSGPDVICALGGRDIVDVGGGEDVIFAGAGNDVVTAGEGEDRIFAGPGRDVLRARDDARGNDLADGGTGLDACSADPEDRRVSCP